MKLNIGGQQGLVDREIPKGWTCVDLLPGADITCDIQNTVLPIEDNSVEAIYCSHVLEHLWPWNHIFTVREFLRVLKPGGQLRVVVPDMDIAIQIYLKSKNKGMALASCMRWWFNPTQDEEGRIIFGHVGSFNYTLLHMLIEKAGFGDITRKAYEATNYPVFKGWDNPIHERTSIYIEAMKAK